MKRKTQKAFAGILIAGLTVGTAMTSATTASAATKKVKLSKSKVTVTEKKKTTLRRKTKRCTEFRWVHSVKRRMRKTISKN